MADAERKSRVNRSCALGALLTGLFLLVAATTAVADTTHIYLESWNVPAGMDPQVGAVDNEGNVYVMDTTDPLAIHKYDAHGNPVDFAALDTNVLDGAGGFDCPNTASDCDRNPISGLRETSLTPPVFSMAI